MLMIPDVPVHHAGKQTAYLLHNSEYYFPPLNAVCTLSNIILAGTAFVYRGNSRIADFKWPRLAVAAGFNLATTAYALGIMVPMNRKMAAISDDMQKVVSRGDEKSSEMKIKELELRRLQSRWRKLNYGRAVIMIGAALAGMSALLVN